MCICQCGVCLSDKSVPIVCVRGLVVEQIGVNLVSKNRVRLPYVLLFVPGLTHRGSTPCCGAEEAVG